MARTKLKSTVLVFERASTHELDQLLDEWLERNPKYGVKSATTSHYPDQLQRVVHVLTVVVKWLPLMNDNIVRDPKQKENGQKDI